MSPKPSTGPNEKAAVARVGGMGRSARAWVIAAGATVGVGAILIAVFGAGAGPGGNTPVAKSADNRPTLDSAEAATMDFDIATTATGEIAAAKQIEIRSPLERDTTITELVDEGKQVKAGDVLVRLNDDTLKTQLDEESLQLESAKAAVVDADEGYKIQLSENESNLRQAELKVQIARLELEQWKQGIVESRHQELDHALERAEKDEARLSDKLDKAKSLFAKGYYSLDQLKSDELEFERAQAELEKTRLDKDIFWQFEYPKDRQKKESDVDQAVSELERTTRQANSKKVSKEADLKNKTRSLQIREEKYKKYKEQVESAVMKAPTGGLVVYASSLQSQRGWFSNEGPLQVGSKVYPNQALLVLPDTSEMVASVRIHESLASIIKPGQRATVKVDALGGERYSGKVESIGILAEQTNRWMDPNLREYTVKIALDLPKAPKASGSAEPPGSSPTEQTKPQRAVGDANAEKKPAPETMKVAEGADAGSETVKKDSGATEKTAAVVAAPVHRLKPSMRCEAEILVEQVKDVLTVPIQAVFNEGPLRFVHVQDGSRYARRPVLVGRRSDRFAEIKVGLASGERVLIRKPGAAEVVARPWGEKELAAVGLRADDQGQIVPLPVAAVPSTPPVAPAATTPPVPADAAQTAKVTAKPAPSQPATVAKGAGSGS